MSANMEAQILTFKADGQNLVKTNGINNFASDTVNYVKAKFILGENWTQFPEVKAMWFIGDEVIPTTLDEEGTCTIPKELLTQRKPIEVNLCGTILENGFVKYRLTTEPIVALKVIKKAEV